MCQKVCDSGKALGRGDCKDCPPDDGVMPLDCKGCPTDDGAMPLDCKDCPPKVLIATLGCRLNQTESEGLAASYREAGCEVMLKNITASDDTMPFVSLVIVNTCAVTQKAQQKARRDIRLLLDKCPRARVIVTGCYAALSSAEIKSISSRVEVVSGVNKASPTAYLNVMALLAEGSSQALSPPPTICFDGKASGQDEGGERFALFTAAFQAHSRASLKVQDGCNNNCAFCTIHIARGPSVSLPVHEAVRRAWLIEENGYHEATLTGVNIGEYRCSVQDAAGGGSAGWSLSRRSRIETEKGCSAGGLAYLLEALLVGTKTLRFRLSSLHPDAIDEELCRVVRDPRVREHFHLSVQSGSDKILRAMNRGYTAADVINAVRRLREAKDNPFIACDIIAGFPGESEEDAAQTAELCSECGFSHIHVFPFSPRPGTAAFSMRPCVPQETAGKRVRVLEEISKRGMASFVNRCAGNVYEAIVEREDDADSGGSEARNTIRAVTSNFLHVVCTLDDYPVHGLGNAPFIKQGDMIKVRITHPVAAQEDKYQRCVGRTADAVGIVVPE